MGGGREREMETSAVRDEMDSEVRSVRGGREVRRCRSSALWRRYRIARIVTFRGASSLDEDTAPRTCDEELVSLSPSTPPLRWLQVTEDCPTVTLIALERPSWMQTRLTRRAMQQTPIQ